MEQKTDAQKTILIVEDEKNIVDILRFNLQREGYRTVEAYDGADGLEKARKENPDLILLDVMLPKMIGFDVCRTLREEGNNVPVIILTAREEEADKVSGLEIGADDYIVKPFDSNELVARVGALLRRCNSRTDNSQNYNPTNADHIGTYVEYDNLVVNISNYTVTLEGKNLEMPPKELELLYFLASRPNQVFTREQLLDKLWGYEYVGDTRTVDVHIKRLREKLTDKYNWSIFTVWGIGYKFEVK